MISAARLAWLQLEAQKVRLMIALAGVAFAVLLIFMQLGFQDALFTSAVSVHSRLNGEIILVSPLTNFLASMRPFTRRRLYQAAAFPGVESVSPIYASLAPWKNPETRSTREIFVLGVDPSHDALDFLGASEREQLRYPDRVVFDRASRPEFGPVAAIWERGEKVATEVNNREVTVSGLLSIGTSFGIDGTIVTSDLNFLRVFPNRPPGLINIGVIKLAPGADVKRAQAAMVGSLERDVLVLTKEEYMQREKDYWGSATPIGYVFGFGVIMGLVVGGIIVYQVLFADISDHLPEYATLKAMGYSNGFLVRIVLVEALVLAIAGFVPGSLISAQLYRVSSQATMLPLTFDAQRAAIVLLLTIAMCWTSALIAVRKVRSADPAEIF